MRSKAPLVMMEQMVMLLVFALAAALCLQAFVQSDEMSKRGEARDRAVALCQTTAEALRSTGGDFGRAAELLSCDHYSQDSLMIDYKEDWSPADGSMRYTLGAARIEADTSGLGKAGVWVRDEADDVELFRIEVAWQEVSAHG